MHTHATSHTVISDYGRKLCLHIVHEHGFETLIQTTTKTLITINRSLSILIFMSDMIIMQYIYIDKREKLSCSDHSLRRGG